ncbi:MAG: hypothetical protein KBA28_04270, partial [Syntrophaceae bacterium]|nr:hypothetical protein [Syntrophaceae bacterium]
CWNVLQKKSSMQHPTFCGQYFLDTQVRVSYTSPYKKEVLININQFLYFTLQKGSSYQFILHPTKRKFLSIQSMTFT